MQPRSHRDSSRKKAILEASSIVTQLKFAPRCGPHPLTLPSARTRTSAFRIARRGLGPAPASVPNMRSGFPCRPAVRPACVKMAASLPHTLLSRFPNLLRSSYGVQVPLRTLCTKGPPEEGSPSSLPISPYENEPWKYLDSEEYQNRYGSRPIWADYRRNHKGGVPPQRTRKTCIRKNKVAGNPCPICRDHKLHVDFRNVKLLEQFVCAHTGVIFHAPYTGVCMKQHKKLTQAIQKARECGLLSHYVPQVEPRDADFSAVHGAVSVTPPAPTLLSGQPWYPWYSWQQPPERELSRLRRLYQGNLLEESGPPPESMPEVPSTPPAGTSPEQMGSQSA